jgi:hypothetical protein
MQKCCSERVAEIPQVFFCAPMFERSQTTAFAPRQFTWAQPKMAKVLGEA